MFTILQRYIFKQFFITLAAIIVVLLGFFVLVRFTEEVNHFVKIADSTPFMTFVKYFVYEMPYTLTYLFPLAVMFTTVFVLGRLNANRELYILFTVGKGIFYYVFPIFVVLLTICTIFFVFDKELFYDLHLKHRILGRELKNQEFFNTSERVDFVQFGSDNKIYMIGGFDPVKGDLRKLHIVFLNKLNQFHSLFTADTGIYLSDGKWEFRQAYEQNFSKEILQYDFHNKTMLELGEEPYHFDRVYIAVPDLSARQVKKQAEKIERIGGNSKKWWTEYYFKGATPYIAIVMFLFAIPLSMFSKTAVLVISFFLVLITAFIYMIFMNIGVSLGHNGVVPPWLGGWMGNIVFFMIAMLLYYKFRK